MNAVKQQVQGQLLTANGRYALLLHNTHPKPEARPFIYLRYAFITMNTEEHIFPAFLLDDWGSEIKTLELYNWVDEFASQFPRAELFGFAASGQETQLFLRELEPYSKLPCYAYPTVDTPINNGLLVDAILLPDETVTEPLKIQRPSWVKRPLRRAQVHWWQVPSSIQNVTAILT